MVRIIGHARHARATTVVASGYSATPNISATSGIDESWRATACLPLKAAARVAGVSTASLYTLEQKGVLKFRRIAGRTVVVTATLAALIDGGEPWAPSNAGAAARARRAELAKANWTAADAA